MKVDVIDSTGKGHWSGAVDVKEDVVAGVVEHVVMQGKLVKEMFVGLMEMMVMRGDEERSRA